MTVLTTMARRCGAMGAGDDVDLNITAPQDMKGHIGQLLDELERFGERATPFWKREYIAHMNTVIHLGSYYGTVAGLLANPNAIVQESAPGLLELEIKAIEELLRMVGLDPARGGGHLTSGGTIANYDAIWRARKLKEACLEMGPPHGRLSAEGVEEALRRWSPDEILDAYGEWRSSRGAVLDRPILWQPGQQWPNGRHRQASSPW